jgi:hypothetical protein
VKAWSSTQGTARFAAGRLPAWATATSIALLVVVHPAGANQSDKAECARGAEEGQRLRAQGKLREALIAFTACASDSCPGLVRGDCGGWLAEVQSALPTVVVRASAAEDGQHELFDVEVQVDGVPLTRKLDGRALPVNPGEHHFSFASPGRVSATETVVVRVGEQHRQLAVALVSEHPLPAAPSQAPAARARLRPAARVLLIAGGAALAVSAGFGVAGWLEARSLRDSHCAPACDPDAVTSARRLLRVADISLAAGVLSLAAGLIWLRPTESSARVEITPVGGGALIGLRWGAPTPW